MQSLTMLGGGAAQGLVERLAPVFKARTGLDIAGEFSAVGAMAAKLRAGTPADLVILTDGVVDDLCRDGLLIASSQADIGRVETAIAVRSNDPAVTIGDAEALRDAFLAADAIFVPDMVASTAGTHVARVLAQLGIAAEVMTRLRIFANGMTAMRELARSDCRRPIGCTQMTEIIRTNGLKVIGPLPAPCALATTYTAAIARRSLQPSAGQTLIDLLVSPDQRSIREEAGFLTRGADPIGIGD